MTVLLYADVSIEVEKPGADFADHHCECHPGESREVAAVVNVNSDSAPRRHRLLLDYAVCAERLAMIHRLVGIPAEDDATVPAAQERGR